VRSTHRTSAFATWAIAVFGCAVFVAHQSHAQSEIAVDQEVTAETLVAQLPADRLPGAGYALLIGIDSYADAGLPGIDNAERDMELIRSALLRTPPQVFRPNTVAMLRGADATRQDVLDAVQWLVERTSENDVAILCFSGHGAWLSEGRNRTGYWLAHDTDRKNIENTAINLRDIDRQVRSIKGQVIVIADAIYWVDGDPNQPGTPNRVFERLLPIPDDDRGIALLAGDSVRRSSVIAKEETEGFDHSLIAAHFAEGIAGGFDWGHHSDRDGFSELEELADALVNAVWSAERQAGTDMKPRLTGTFGRNFVIGSDGERLRQLAIEREADRQRFLRITNLAEDGVVTDEDLATARSLLLSNPLEQDESAKARRRIFQSLADGGIPPDQLATMLARSAETPGPAESRALHVPGDHATIQLAIDSARRGDTVVIAAGRYEESLTLRDGVSLRAAEGEQVVVAWDGLRGAVATATDCPTGFTISGLTFEHTARDLKLEVRETVLHLVGTRAIVEHCTIRASAGRGVVVGENSDVELRHCRILDSGYIGVLAHSNTTRIVISDCTIDGSVAYGISVQNCRDAIIARNTCENNQWFGMHLKNTHGAQVLENTIRKNAQTGIFVVDSHEFKVDSNTCEDNGNSGIVIAGSRSSGEVRNNVSRRNRNGIFFQEGASGTATGNTCEDNQMQGFTLDDEGTNPMIRENTIRKNAEYGILVHNGATARIEQNEIAEQLDCGIHVEAGSTVEIVGNTIHDNKNFGVHVVDANASVLDNVFTGNGSGIGVEAERAYAMIRGNAMRDHKYCGVLIRNTGRAMVQSNRSSGNGEHGFVIADRGSEAEFLDNVAEDNSWSGITADRNAKAIVRHNTCRSNGTFGISFMTGATGEIIANTCEENRRSGIGLGAECAATVSLNQLRRNEGFGLDISVLANPTIRDDNEIEDNTSGDRGEGGGDVPQS